MQRLKKYLYYLYYLINMEPKITYKGLKKLDPFDISTIQTLVERYFPKIERHFSNASLTVDVKKAAKEGRRARYTILLRVTAPNKVILSAEHTDWELQRAIHRAFDNIKSEARHRFDVGVVKRTKKSFREMK